MKTFIAVLVSLVSQSIYACQCTYDWKDKTHIDRAAVLLEIPAANFTVTDYNVYNTPRSLLDSETYSQCGCTRFVRQVYDVNFHYSDHVCTGKVVYSRNLDKIKVKKINCKQEL
jgi:hypothetical protein